MSNLIDRLTQTEIPVEARIIHQVIRNSQCPEFPGCMPDLADPTTWVHSSQDHIDAGLVEDVVESDWVQQFRPKPGLWAAFVRKVRGS